MTRPSRKAARLLATPLKAARLTRTRIGLGLAATVMLIAVAGPHFAPHAPGDFVGPPFSGPTSHHPLGTDNLGRDVLSRFLCGGGVLLATSFLATLASVGLGTAVGVTAGYSAGRLDEALMRTADLFLVFPPIVLALLFLSISGPQTPLMVVLVSVSFAPRVARVVRGATLRVTGRDFVLAAEAIGAPRRHTVRTEILPNIMDTLMVEFGLRLTYAIGLIAALAFLGLGRQPPAADWGLMINENRIAIAVQPWGVLMPVLAIALLTVGMNLVTDGLARASLGIDTATGHERA